MPTVQKLTSLSRRMACNTLREPNQVSPKHIATPPREPQVPGAFGRYPSPNAVAMASETRGFRATLLVVGIGMFGVGWLIRLDLFGFRLVHHGHGHFIFLHGPVPEVAFAAALTAERKLRRCFRIHCLLADGTFQFHVSK